MSTVKMLRTSIVGVKSEQKIIMDLLTRSGNFEVTQTKGVKSVVEEKKSTHLDKVMSKQARVLFAIEYLDKLNEEAKERNIMDEKLASKNPSVSFERFEEFNNKSGMSRIEKGYDDFYDITASEYELMSKVEILDKINFARTEIRSQINKLTMFNRNLAPYAKCDLKFSRLSDTKQTSVMLALGTIDSSVKSFADLCLYTQNYETEGGVLVAIICKKDDKLKVSEKLSTNSFTLCTYSYDKTASEIITDNNAQINVLEAQYDEKLREGLLYSKYYESFKTLYDVQGLDIESSEAELQFIKTKATFVLEGWVSVHAIEPIKEQLYKKTKKIVIQTREPEGDDEPPTLMKSSAIIKPFEGITNNYSPPAYGELDPNTPMAFFFFIFFGIMLGDAGYGLILSIACAIIVSFFKLEKGMKETMVMFGICGISAVIFGLIFGGIFAIDSVEPLWFNPLEDPLKMLIFSLVLGCIQLLVGFTMKMIKKMRDGRILDGICDALFMYMLFGGVACFCLPMVFTETDIPFQTIAIGLLVGALVGILLTNGRNAPSIGGKIAGGLGGLYDLINLFSDVLSYSRLFGLALSSAAIGMAFNMICSMLFGIPIVGYVFGAILLVALHAFNFALSLLSAYVHNIRLQYLEFYGKFYEGEGRLFDPLGQKTRYVRFVEKNLTSDDKTAVVVSASETEINSSELHSVEKVEA